MRSHPLKHLLLTTALVLAAPALAHVPGHSHGHEHDDIARHRLIVADADAPRVTVADGRLVRFSALTWRVLAEAPGITAAYAVERGVIRPMMAVAGDLVAISDPGAGSVVLIAADADHGH